MCMAEDQLRIVKTLTALPIGGKGVARLVNTQLG
jgi:hypothetical protein